MQCDQVALARLQEHLQPGVMLPRGEALLAAQLGNAVISTQAFEHDADLVLGGDVAPMSFSRPFRGIRRRFCLNDMGLIIVTSSQRRSPNQSKIASCGDKFAFD
jgi:hypothetical protein